MSFKKLFRILPSMPTDSGEQKLLSALGPWDLVLLGIGAIVGAGIFIITGIASATMAGPAITISFIVAGLACAFAALCYAELASSVQGSGSAYGYAYASMGELLAWIIGWDLLLEYGLAVSAVAVGWSHYFGTVMLSIGVPIPSAFMEGGIVNLPAMLIVFVICLLLMLGIKNSARANGVMVLIKLSVLALFIVIASMHIHPSNWTPFAPFGWKGIMSGASMVFFAYLGFDAVSTAAEETKNPARDLPIGIIGSLAICTALYIVIAILLTGMAHYTTLNNGSPIAQVLLNLGYRFSAALVSVGALTGLTTVMLVLYYALTRVCYAISRDGLLPLFFSKIDPSSHVPSRNIVFFGVVLALISGFVKLGTLAELVNIGALVAFVIVCSAVIILRFTRPEMSRPFKTPFFPLVPILGIGICLYLMFSLPGVTLLRFVVWMAIGVVIFFGYSQRRSRLHKA